MRSLVNRTVTVIVLLSIFCVPLARSSQDTQTDIVVAEGTPINVVVAQEVTSKLAKPNDRVEFTVDEDVTMNGQVVVRKGTPAVGSVINAEKGGYMGKSGKLAVQVESTQTVDGQPLKLRAAKGKEGKDKTTSTFALSIISGFFLFKKGGEAKIVPGTPVTVYVAEEKRFRMDGSTLVAVAPPNEAGAIELKGAAEPATVFIYRPNKLLGKALEPSVFVDQIELARMDNGRYFAIKLKPGKHIVHMTSDKKGYALDMGPGQTYFFRIGIEMGMLKGRGKLTLDDPEKAIEEIKKLKFIGADKVRAPTMVVEISPDGGTNP
jgi:hypothetical protein